MAPFLHIVLCSAGGESLWVATQVYAASWFQNEEHNMAVGMILSCTRLVSMKTKFVKYVLMIVGLFNQKIIHLQEQ